MLNRKAVLLLSVALILPCVCWASKAKAVFRIECGSEKDFKDKSGNVWSADPQEAVKKGWSEKIGAIVDRGSDLEIKNTDTPEIYRTEKYGAMDYHFKVKNGTYRVVLHFAETYAEINSAGMREFGVTINGVMVLNNFDVYKEAGALDTAVVKEFPGIAVKNGEIEIVFVPGVEEPEVNGIEIFKQ
jgi:hypothetical protein